MAEVMAQKRRKFGLDMLHDYVKNIKLELRSLWDDSSKTEHVGSVSCYLIVFRVHCE